MKEKYPLINNELPPIKGKFIKREGLGIIEAMANRKYIQPPLYELKINDMPIKTGAREGEEYFTPDITDIRVGYECECLWCCAEPREWKLIKITAEDNMNTIELPIEEAIYRVIDNEIRVPYLTKKQIEAEGWKFVESNKAINILTFKIIVNDHSWYELDYFTDSKTLLITKYYIHGDEDLGLYNGECKEINTFRYILKLLGI